MSNKVITEAMKVLLEKTGSQHFETAQAAQADMSLAVAEVIREGIQSGDIVTDIFTEVPLGNNAIPEFPLDFLAPGTENDYVAYTIPQHGYIPQKHIESDYVMIPTYSVGNSIDWLLKYARMARWDIVTRALEVMRMGFVKKTNDDGWHVLMAAAVDRNILVYDSDAAAGNFTKRLVTLLKTIVARNGGGNSSSVNHRVLTDLYVSIESQDDMRNWGIDQVDEVTRRELITREDGMINRIFGVNLHGLYEFGVGQEYQLFFTSTLAGALATGDVELVIGLDQLHNDSFKMPTRGTLQIFNDPTLHRSQREGYYGWKEMGFGVLDNRNVIAGSY